MFINEKVVNLERIKEFLEELQNEETNNEFMAIFKIGREELSELRVFTLCKTLTYDEMIYLQQHSDLMTSDYDRKMLNSVIEEWNNIIQQISVALSNGTIEDYLAIFKSNKFGVSEMIHCFGLDAEGITLTEKGEVLLPAIKKQIDILDAQMVEVRKQQDLLAQEKGFVSWAHYLLTVFKEKYPDRAEEYQKKIDEEIRRCGVQVISKHHK